MGRSVAIAVCCLSKINCLFPAKIEENRQRRYHFSLQSNGWSLKQFENGTYRRYVRLKTKEMRKKSFFFHQKRFFSKQMETSPPFNLRKPQSCKNLQSSHVFPEPEPEPLISRVKPKPAKWPERDQPALGARMGSVFSFLALTLLACFLFFPFFFGGGLSSNHPRT